MKKQTTTVSIYTDTVLLLLLLPIITIKTCLCNTNIDKQYLACEPQSCGGNGINISYPFWILGQQDSYCGYPGFDLSCNTENQPVLNLFRFNYTVQDIYYNNQSLRITDDAVFPNNSSSSSSCSLPIQNLTLYGDRFKFAGNLHYTNMFFFSNCSSSSSELNNLTRYEVYGCSANDDHGNGTTSLAILEQDLKLVNVSENNCTSAVKVPVQLYGDEVIGHGRKEGDWWEFYEMVLRRGFVLNYRASDCDKCEKSGGRCGFDEGKYQFRCFCTDKPHFSECSSTGTSLARKVAIATSVVGFGVLVVIGLCLIRRFSYRKRMVFWKTETQANRSIEAYLENYTALAPKRYTYSDIKKMTNTFKYKLGQGGYGGVYKGKLHDGRLVAVKFLNTPEGNGEEFINEVAGIGRTSHVNIVTLLGFCYEGSKRALIYEFMSNGSLEKFIYDKIPLKENRQLAWETLYQIAIGIARGLEYLHHGCSTRILHFDIKPHNILLDEEFCPKISDFGLAKLCPGKESIISMLGARGTAGYIAPEVFCRSFGGISHKSDVYSYGMMVLEMVGGRKNISVGVERISEIYFPHWIYNRLELGNELGLHGVTNEDEDEKARKMILVSLWCIQTDPSIRPSISRVLDMLEGKLESLLIPPKPFLSSPERVPADSSSAPVNPTHSYSIEHVHVENLI